VGTDDRDVTAILAPSFFCWLSVINIYKTVLNKVFDKLYTDISKHSTFEAKSILTTLRRNDRQGDVVLKLRSEMDVIVPMKFLLRPIANS
jgi:hypothetical protein